MVKSVESPNSAGRIFYVDHRRRPDGTAEFPILFENARGRRTLLLVMDRSIAVRWSPRGGRFFINNYEGSNLTDCFVVKPARNGVQGVSLTAVVERTLGHPTGLERPIVSHYYVTCRRWISNDRLSAEINGHTDEAGGGHDFRYAFVYDAARNRIGWRH